MIPVDPPVADTATVVVELDRQECLHLLAAAPIGRVVVTDRALPAAYPVPYLLDAGEVLFRAAPAGRLAAAAIGKIVGFQADELDLHARTGWSVLGIGQAYEVVDAARLADLEDRLPEPWSADPAPRTVAVSLERLAGRRIEKRRP